MLGAERYEEMFNLGFLFWLSGARVEAAEFASYEIPRTEVIPIQDTHAGKQYELYVKLPDKYHEKPDARYPVIYYTDGVWHIELLYAATVFLMEDAILVGISWQQDMKEEFKKKGAHVSRFWDYSVRNRKTRSAKPNTNLVRRAITWRFSAKM